MASSHHVVLLSGVERHDGEKTEKQGVGEGSGRYEEGGRQSESHATEKNKEKGLHVYVFIG